MSSTNTVYKTSAKILNTSDSEMAVAETMNNYWAEVGSEIDIASIETQEVPDGMEVRILARLTDDQRDTLSKSELFGGPWEFE